MRRIYLVCALLLSTSVFGSASAAPAHYGKGLSSDSALIKVQYHHPPHHAAPARVRHPHYRPGGRYRTAPHGWHRYHARPRDWRTRGCVIVGPVWFCP